MAEKIKPDLTEFERAAHSLFFNGGLTSRFNLWVAGVVNDELDPSLVSFEALEQMGTHPVIYLAEPIKTGIIRRKDLYTVVHSDPKIVKETEEWLWPLLPKLLGAFARAYAYGSIPVIFNWDRATLKFEVPSKDGKDTRTKTIKNHTHYASVHPIRPTEVLPEHENDDLTKITYLGKDYLPDRAIIIKWDPEFGSFRGQGARRRAWRDYCTSLVIEALEANYLERSVDNPRVAYAPSGTSKVDGVSDPTPQYINSLLMSLRGSGAVTFPSVFDENGNQLYKLETLDLPDREDIWMKAIGRRETRMLWAYLALTGADASAAAAKTVDGLLKEFIQDIAVWVADTLTEIVETVHGANYDTDKVKPPEVEATDVGKTSAKKLLVEVLRMSSGDQTNRWLDVKKTLDRLGAPVLDTELEPPEPKEQGLPGGPDVSSEREERREDARTPEGEDDKGSKNQDKDRDQQA